MMRKKCLHIIIYSKFLNVDFFKDLFINNRKFPEAF